jgi:hypothetical protein
MMYEELQKDPRGLTGKEMGDFAKGHMEPRPGDKSEMGRYLFAVNSPQMAEVSKLRKEWETSKTDEPDTATRMMVHGMDSDADNTAYAAQVAAEKMAELVERERRRKEEEEGLMGLPGYQQKMRNITGGN